MALRGSSAIRHRPVQLAPRLTVLLWALDAVAPRAVGWVLLRWG